MVNEIKELIEYIEGSGSGILNSAVKSLSPMSAKLYNFIKVNEQCSDKLASVHVYGHEPNGAYYNLRRRLHFDLLTSSLNHYRSTENKRKTYDEIRDYCLSQMSSIRLLQTKGLLQNLVYVSKDVLKYSLKYQFNDINVEALKVLLNFYGSANRNIKLFKKYRRLYIEIEELRRYEDEIQLKYYDFYSLLPKINNNLSNAELNEFVSVSKLSKNIEFDYSFKTTFFSFNILCLYYLTTQRYEELEETAKKGFAYMENAALVNKRLSIFFLERQLTAEMKLNKRQKMATTFSLIDERLESKSQTKYVVGIYKSLLCFHDQDFIQAEQIVVGLVKTKMFKQIAESIAEYLQLMLGYLEFLDTAGVYNGVNLPSFRIYKFLNEIPLYQRDKRGANISILILHTLFLMLNRKEDELIDRIDALRLYSYRYLRKDETFRSNCFIRMLIEMTKADFHPIRTERYTADLLKKLKSVPLELSEQPLEVEIIPYEDLWEMVMKLLERNSKIRRGRPRKQL